MLALLGRGGGARRDRRLGAASRRRLGRRPLRVPLGRWRWPAVAAAGAVAGAGARGPARRAGVLGRARHRRGGARRRRRRADPGRCWPRCNTAVLGTAAALVAVAARAPGRLPHGRPTASRVGGGRQRRGGCAVRAARPGDRALARVLALPRRAVAAVPDPAAAGLRLRRALRRAGHARGAGRRRGVPRASTTPPPARRRPGPPASSRSSCPYAARRCWPAPAWCCSRR